MILVFLCVALASGCSTRAQVNANSNTAAGAMSQPPAGTAITSGSAGLNVQTAGGNSIAAALIAIGLLGGMLDYAREQRLPAPQLAPDRVVNEQDCSKPIVDWSANLKCR
jgi:hypothetical protein